MTWYGHTRCEHNLHKYSIRTHRCMILHSNTPRITIWSYWFLYDHIDTVIHNVNITYIILHSNTPLYNTPFEHTVCDRIKLLTFVWPYWYGHTRCEHSVYNTPLNLIWSYDCVQIVNTILFQRAPSLASSSSHRTAQADSLQVLLVLPGYGCMRDLWQGVKGPKQSMQLSQWARPVRRNRALIGP